MKQIGSTNIPRRRSAYTAVLGIITLSLCVFNYPEITKTRFYAEAFEDVSKTEPAYEPVDEDVLRNTAESVSGNEYAAEDENAYAAETEKETETELEPETEEETEPIPYPEFLLDLTLFQEENEDVQGMIYIPALDLVYPVVWKAFENNYYMEHNIWQEEDPRGCIMIDGWNTPDLTDCMTLVHGHNMADGSMFGSLRYFLNDSSLAQREPYVYYYCMKDNEICGYRYQICSYYTTDIYDRTYDQPEIYVYYHGEVWDSYSEETQSMLDVLRNNWYDYLAAALEVRAIHPLPVPNLDNRPHLMMLSTCYGAVHSDERLIVACVRR